MASFQISVRPGFTAWLRRFWLSWRWYIIFLFGFWIPVRSVVADYNPVPSGSMNPTILEGDVVGVNKLAYGLRVPLTRTWMTTWAEPARGEIVVVFSPADDTRLVKRVVAVPGDTIAMDRNRLIINGRPLPYAEARQDYADDIARSLRSIAVFAEEQIPGAAGDHAVMGLPPAPASHRSFGPVTVPAGRYFVMGDNRDNSFDSRYFGFVPREAIVGRAGSVLVSLDVNDTWLPRFRRFFTGLR
jgi:signal peptidase I